MPARRHSPSRAVDADEAGRVDQVPREPSDGMQDAVSGDGSLPNVGPTDEESTDESASVVGEASAEPMRGSRQPTSLSAYAWFRALTAPVYWLYERRLESGVLSGPLPKHIGIIMDGNRRFARLAGVNVEQGHDVGASKAHEVLDWCLELGIPHVTLWGFSSDNKGRSPAEVAHLHALFAKQARSLADDARLREHRVRVRVIGDTSDFSDDAQDALRAIEERTADHDGMHLNLALGYGGREEIVAAVRDLLAERSANGATLREVAEELDAAAIDEHLWTRGMPDPDFVIRTSGEVRLSGFLLWQTAYAEFYFCDAFWPDFRRLDFLRALRSFQARERRFGR